MKENNENIRINTIPLTLHIKNSEISEYSGGVAHIGLRQICRFDYLKKVAIWLLWFNELKPLLSATALAPARCGAFNDIGKNE